MEQAEPLSVADETRIRYWSGCVQREQISYRTLVIDRGSDFGEWVATYCFAQQRQLPRGSWKAFSANDRATFLVRALNKAGCVDSAGFIGRHPVGERNQGQQPAAVQTLISEYFPRQ